MQTYENWELIVAAHGCTDGTHCLTRYYAHRDQFLRKKPARIRLLIVPRTRTYPPTAENHWLAGPVVPINAALKEVKGDFIARIDDDDEWTPDHLERLVAFAMKGGYEFVSAAHETHEGKVEPYDLDGVRVGGVQSWLYRSYLRFMKANPSCWRKSWDAVNDVDLQRRFRNAGVRMGYLDHVVARVLPRPNEVNVGLAAYVADREAKEKHFAF